MSSFIEKQEEYIKNKIKECGYEVKEVVLNVSSRPEFGDYQYNGVMASDSAILGIPPLENERLNIVDFNAEYNALPNIAILGYDDSAFLVYDNAENKYKLIDRYDGIMLDEYLEDELVYALNSILHI